MNKPKFYDGSVYNGIRFLAEIPARQASSGNTYRMAKWQCSCGNIFTCAISALVTGNTKSCGCKQKLASTKHGKCGTRIHRTWKGIKSRCYNKNAPQFQRYGGRGIKMYAPWSESFVSFYAWFKSHFGMDDIPDNLSIDRVNNDGDYEPSNLRLATSKEQANNHRRNRIVSIDGENMTCASLADHLGLKYGTVLGRLKRGCTIDRVCCPVNLNTQMPLTQELKGLMVTI